MSQVLFLAILTCCVGIVLGCSRLLSDKEHAKTWGFTAVYLLFLLLDTARYAHVGGAAVYGALFALGYAGAMLWQLRLPVPVSAMLVCSQTLVWALFSIGAWKLWSLPFPASVLLIACWGTALFWLEWALLPLWGTGQNFACSVPINSMFVSCVGTAGGTWSLLVVCAWLHTLFTGRKSLSEALVIGASGAVVLGVLRFVGGRWFSPRNPKILRVATLGWAGTSSGDLAQFQSAAREAHGQNAKLLVTPEAAIHVQNRVEFRVTLCSLAQKYDLALAVGYFDDARGENCIDLISSNGEVVGRYVKTHLVPLMESYNKGRGEIALMEVDGIRVGGLICQDDNFPDIARRYAKAGAQLLVVPTNDWSRVKNIHFANHIWRALEFRFALARAASQGISALTSFDGEVETSSDHFTDGAKLLVADVRVDSGKPTLYAKSGDWFPVACGLAAIVGLWFAG